MARKPPAAIFHAPPPLTIWKRAASVPVSDTLLMVRVSEPLFCSRAVASMGWFRKVRKLMPELFETFGASATKPVRA